MVYILKKNNAMSELLSRTNDRGYGPQSTAVSHSTKGTPRRTQPVQNRPLLQNDTPVKKPSAAPAVKAGTKKSAGSYSKALRRSAGFIRNISIAVAVLFTCTVAVTAAIIFSPSDEENALVADFALGEVATDAEAEVLSETADTKVEEKHKVIFNFYKKDSIVCTTADRTVGELIDLLGIELSESETARTDLSASITEDTEINVDNVSYETITVDYAIDYDTEYVDVESVPKGKKVVHREGTEGVKTVTYKVTYLNGNEIEREQTDEYVSKAPVSRIVYNGVGGMVNIGGTYYSYSAKLNCKSTVYSGGGTTASGLPASEAVIAVDPRVIPLGSRVYIEGVGIRTAADTGGSIKGNFIDIYYDQGNPAYYGYGIKYVNVYILD